MMHKDEKIIQKKCWNAVRTRSTLSIFIEHIEIFKASQVLFFNSMHETRSRCLKRDFPREIYLSAFRGIESQKGRGNCFYKNCFSGIDNICVSCFQTI
jgi:hypothetical protein